MMEQFVYSDLDLITQTAGPDKEGKRQLSKFDRLLRSKWDAAVDMGYFRYTLDQLRTKIVPGPKRLVAQLNIKRAVERRKPQTMSHVTQGFNPELFNFTKVHSREVLFELCPERETDSHTLCNDSLSNGLADSLHHSVLINVSPLEYCNILLVPKCYHGLPQVLTEDGIHLALETVLLSAHSGFILGFNSLCAFASVNHLHFHGYYLEHELAIKTTPTRPVKGPCHELVDWPVKGFVFQDRGHTVQEMARSIHKVASIFQQKNMAHNLLITRGSALGDGDQQQQAVRAVLWPRNSFFGTKNETFVGFNAAVCELAGHLPIFNEECFDNMTEEKALGSLKSVALSTEEFTSLKDEVTTVFKD